MSIPRVFEQSCSCSFLWEGYPPSPPALPIVSPLRLLPPRYFVPGAKKALETRDKGKRGLFPPGPFSSSWRHDERRGTEGGESLLLPFLPVYLFSLRISLLSQPGDENPERPATLGLRRRVRPRISSNNVLVGRSKEGGRERPPRSPSLDATLNGWSCRVV